jgi:hypothetical protein
VAERSNYQYLSLCALISALSGGCGFVDNAGDGANQAPVVSSADVVAQEQTQVTLSSLIVDDFENIASYRWAQTDDGATRVVLEGANAATATFLAPVVTVPESPLRLVFTLTVTDNFGEQGTDTVNVDVLAVNAAPRADAGPDQTVKEGGRVSLTGSGTDPDGTIEHYRWVQTAGPGVVLSAADAQTMSFLAPSRRRQDGAVQLGFQLTVTDNETTTGSDTLAVWVTPDPIAPTANPDTARTPAGRPVVIDVVANDTDVDGFGTIVRASVRISSPPSHGAVAVHDNGRVTYTPAPGFSGVDRFRYTVQDEEDAISNPATVTIEVLMPPAGGGAGAVDKGNTGDKKGDTGPKEDNDPNAGQGRPKDNNKGKEEGTADDGRDDEGRGQGGRGKDREKGRGGRRDRKVFLQRAAQGARCWNAAQGQILSGRLDQGSAPVRVTYRLVNQGAQGQMVITDPTTGRFEYTPHPGARGRDTFVYELDDPLAGVSVSTATVIINPRIMPLGDAITAGILDGANALPPHATRVGYRLALFDALREDGYQVDLVGGLRDGVAFPGFDPDHEGHPGWTAGEVAFGRLSDGTDGVYAWLQAHPADIVLLHMGTASFDTSAAQVAAILDEIDRWESSALGNPVTVLVARIIARDPVDPGIAVLNEGLEALVQDRIQYPVHPDALIWVDLHGALSYPQDLFDGVHPTGAGYAKMATRWRDALASHRLLDRCP